MKKLLSILLSVMLILGTMSVLTMLPAVATTTGTATGPVNLIVNGDGDGIDTDDDGVKDKTIYTEDDEALSSYIGEFDLNAPIGWRDLNVDYRNTKNFYPHTFKNVPSGYYSNYSKNLVIGLNQGQTLVQEITLEEGKTYQISAKIASNVITSDRTNDKVYMFVDGESGMTAATTPSNGVAWLTTKTFTYEATDYEYGDDGETVTKTYYSAGDFTDHQITFSADEFAKANSLTAVDGKYSARLVFKSAVWGSAFTLYDDITMYEVADFTTEGGYVDAADVVHVGETTTITAVPYYGNAFLGWYNGEELVSSNSTFTGVITSDLTAKFDVRNLIINGDMEVVGAQADALSVYNNAAVRYGSYRGTASVLSTTGIANTDTATYGNYVMQLTPNSASSADKQKGLINFPVTVEKNTNYIWRFSYKYIDDTSVSYNTSNLHYIRFSIDSLNASGKIPWDSACSGVKWSYHSQKSGTKAGATGFTNVWSWGGGNSFTASSQNDNGTTTNDYWQDVYVLFNPGEDAGIFTDSNSNKGTIYLSLGTANATVDPIFIDNMSVTKAVSNNMTTVTTEGNGTTVAQKLRTGEDYYVYTEYARGNASVYTGRDTENVYYPTMYETYTATPSSGGKFIGWYDADGQLVSTNATESFLMTGGAYTAKFVEIQTFAVTASVEKQNGIYGGYLTGDTEFSVPEGESVTVTATTYVGNTFDGWYDGNNKLSSDLQFTYTPTKDTNLVAKYNIANMWPDSGYENTVRDVSILSDKALNADANAYFEWNSYVPSQWWEAKVLSSKPYSGEVSLELTHRNNEVLRRVTGLSKNTDYELSFYWFIRSSAVNSAGDPSYLKQIRFYDDNGKMFSYTTLNTEYDADFQQTKVYFNTGDNENVYVAITYYAANSSIVCDDFCLIPGTSEDYVTVSYDSGDERVGITTELALKNSEYNIKTISWKDIAKDFTNWSIGDTIYAVGDTITLTEDITFTANYKDFISDKLTTESTFDPSDYDFTFAVLPDEQKLLLHYPDYYTDITDWILENEETYKIAGILNMGDITEHGSYEQWFTTYNSFKKLFGKIPHAISLGNHDYADGGSTGTYNGKTNRNTAIFNHFYKQSDFSNVPEWGGAYDDSMDNTYHKFTIGNNKIMVVSLEIFPRYEVLEWASDIIEANSDYKVIVTTHAHLDDDGSRLGDSPYIFTDNEESSNPQEVWDQLLKVHPNIIMMLCGHVSSSKLVATKNYGDNGNIVYEVLIDNQDDDINYRGVGNVVLLGFKDEGNTVGFTTYSTVQDKYFFADNNEFKLSFTDEPEIPEVPATGDFEGATVVGDIVNTSSTAAAEIGTYDDAMKLDAGYEEGMGDNFLKVEKTAGYTTHCDVSFPISVTQGEKYLAHFKFKVLESYSSDKTSGVLGTGTRFDVRVTANACAWAAATNVAGKITMSSGKNMVKSEGINNFYGFWYHDDFKNAYGDKFMDVYVEIDATNMTTGTAYVSVGLRNGGVFAVDDFTIVNQSELAPTMVGAQIENADTPDEIYYVTNVNIPNYVAISRITTFIMSKAILDSNYPDRVNDFDANTIPECGYVSVRGDKDTGWVVMNDAGTEVVRSGNFYSKLAGTGALNQTAKFSARSEIEISDNYGNSLGIIVATGNDNAEKAIENGVYTRSANQMKRLVAKAFIEGGIEDSTGLITPIEGKALWNCAIDEVWNFARWADAQ